MRIFAILFSAVLFFASGYTASSDVGLLSLTIEEINYLKFSEDNISITCDQFSMDSITGIDDSSTYSLVSNDGNSKKVTVKLDKNIPRMGDLKLTLGTLAGWTAHPNLVVTRSKQNAVSNIPANSIGENLGVNYTLEFPRTTRATKKPEKRKLTFTLSDN